MVVEFWLGVGSRVIASRGLGLIDQALKEAAGWGCRPVLEDLYGDPARGTDGSRQVCALEQSLLFPEIQASSKAAGGKDHSRVQLHEVLL